MNRQHKRVEIVLVPSVVWHLVSDTVSYIFSNGNVRIAGRELAQRVNKYGRRFWKLSTDYVYVALCDLPKENIELPHEDDCNIVLSPVLYRCGVLMWYIYEKENRLIEVYMKPLNSTVYLEEGTPVGKLYFMEE